MTLMTSWAVVCDVYFLEPQTQQPGESAQEFAERVQKLIAKKANLKIGEGGEGYIATDDWCYFCGDCGHLGDVSNTRFF